MNDNPPDMDLDRPFWAPRADPWLSPRCFIVLAIVAVLAAVLALGCHR